MPEKNASSIIKAAHQEAHMHACRYPYQRYIFTAQQDFIELESIKMWLIHVLRKKLYFCFFTSTWVYCFSLLCWRTALFFALYGRVAFLCLSKEKSPKEKILNMTALRVPSDARMYRRDVKLACAQTATSWNLQLILCFSASLNGRLKVKIKD